MKWQQGAEEDTTSSAQRGLTLVELMISITVAVALATASAGLLRDYMATAKTLTVASDANVEMITLLRNIRKSFQSSQPKFNNNRACVLSFGGTAAQAADITRYKCKFQSVGQDPTGGAVPTDGIGFDLLADNTPTAAYVNACEAIPAGFPLASGRGGKLSEPPEDLQSVGNWGGLDKICPAACPAGTRPVVKYLRTGGEVLQRQVPKALNGGNLYLWGATLCASYFRDVVRQEQRLFGDNVGAFLPAYLDVNAFIARGRFDVRKRRDDKGNPIGSLYVWNHGGLHLEFNDAQEMHTFKD